jgi:hypothetical protein
VILLAGCRAPVVEQVQPVAEPVSAPVLPERSDDCAGTLSGWLSSEDGALVFWPSEAWPKGDGVVVRKLGDAGPIWSPRRVLLRRGTDEWFSTLVPGRTPDSVLAVRTIYGEQHVDGRDELVEISTRTSGVPASVVWAPGLRLVLLGRTGSRVILLVYDGALARVAAFDLEDGSRIESAPVDLDLDALTLRPEWLHRSWRLDANDGSNEWSSCRAADEYVLECRGRLCLARIEAKTITIEDVELEWCEEQNPHEYLAPELGPSIERMHVPQGVPVDGRVVHGVRVEIDACAVRTNLEFPSFTPEQPCELEVVGQQWFDELLVGPGCTVSTGFSEYALALPPEQVVIEPMPGRAAWRVRLPYPDVAFADGDCRQGDLWLRALDWSSPARTESWREWEYGYCE